MESDHLNRDQKALIRSTAFAVLRNGTAFFEWLRVKRQDDSAYVFLYGGTGSEYYKWCLVHREEAEKQDFSEESTKQVEVQEVRERYTRAIFRERSRSFSRSRNRHFEREARVQRGRRQRSRSPRRQRRVSPPSRSGRMYAWSDDEGAPKPLNVLREKLESMKQKLNESSTGGG